MFYPLREKSISLRITLLLLLNLSFNFYSLRGNTTPNKCITSINGQNDTKGFIQSIKPRFPGAKTVVVMGAGDVVARLYVPQLLEYITKTGGQLNVTFVDFSRPTDAPDAIAKRTKHRSKILESGYFNYLDRGTTEGEALLAAIEPDYIVDATPPAARLSVLNYWKEHRPRPKVIIMEKPAAPSVETAEKLIANAWDANAVRAFDHYLGKDPVNKEMVAKHLEFLGGIDSFEFYLTENRSGSDPKIKNAKAGGDFVDLNADGPIETEGRQGVLATGLVKDLMPHVLGIFKDYGNLDSIKLRKVHAGRYRGVRGDPNKPTEIPAETFYASQIDFTTVDGQPAKGLFVVGKGLRTKSLGKRYENESKAVWIHGKNGNLIVIDLKGDTSIRYFKLKPGSSSQNQDQMIETPGPVIVNRALHLDYENLPDYAYAELFKALAEGTLESAPLAMPLTWGVKILQTISLLRSPFDGHESELPLYQGGMRAAADGQRPEIQAPDIFELIKTLPPVYDSGSN